MFAQADSVAFVFKPCVRVQVVEKRFSFAKPFSTIPIVHVSASLSSDDSYTHNATVCAVVKRTDEKSVTILLSFKQTPQVEKDVRVRVQYLALTPTSENGTISESKFVRLNHKLIVNSFQTDVGNNDKNLEMITKKIPLLLLDGISAAKTRIHVLATLHHATLFCNDNEEEAANCFTATVLQANSRFVKVMVKRVSANVR